TGHLLFHRYIGPRIGVADVGRRGGVPVIVRIDDGAAHVAFEVPYPRGVGYICPVVAGYHVTVSEVGVSACTITIQQHAFFATLDADNAIVLAICTVDI